jgi:hypothetical protein
MQPGTGSLINYISWGQKNEVHVTNSFALLQGYGAFYLLTGFPILIGIAVVLILSTILFSTYAPPPPFFL